STADAVLRAMASCYRAVGGVVWVARNEELELELASWKAVDPAGLPVGGDALAREARATGAPIRIEGLSLRAGSALTIRSGLGEITPSRILVVPLASAGVT